MDIPSKYDQNVTNFMTLKNKGDYPNIRHNTSIYGISHEIYNEHPHWIPSI